jgi:hypothetical protein
MKSPDRYLFALFVAGLCIMSFGAGSLVLHYKLPSHRILLDAFGSAETWIKVLYPTDPFLEKIDTTNDDINAINEDIIRNPRIAVHEKGVYGGYTLVSFGAMDSAFLVDMKGKIVHRWDMPFRKAWPQAKHVHRVLGAVTFFDWAYAYPNGDLLVQYSALGDTPYGYGIAKLDKDSNVLWTYSENAHHDVYVSPSSGDIYGLIHTMIRTPVKGAELLPYPMLADSIVQLSSDGKELDRIPIVEAFLGSPFELMLYHERNNGLARWDHLHTNSVTVLEPALADKFPMFKAGYIMVSIRSMNALAVINPKTRKVVWAYDGGWKMQHAGHFLDNGHILVFDNNGHFADGKTFSRIIEFDPKTLGIKWHYAGDKTNGFHSVIVGRVQRLPNGNTLIAESMQARIFEVTPQGKTVWSYQLQKATRKDDTLNAIFTSRRYTKNELPFLNEAH